MRSALVCGAKEGSDDTFPSSLLSPDTNCLLCSFHLLVRCIQKFLPPSRGRRGLHSLRRSLRGCPRQIGFEAKRREEGGGEARILRRWRGGRKNLRLVEGDEVAAAVKRWCEGSSVERRGIHRFRLLIFQHCTEGVTMTLLGVYCFYALTNPAPPPGESKEGPFVIQPFLLLLLLVFRAQPSLLPPLLSSAALFSPGKKGKKAGRRRRD